MYQKGQDSWKVPSSFAVVGLEAERQNEGKPIVEVVMEVGKQHIREKLVVMSTLPQLVEEVKD